MPIKPRDDLPDPPADMRHDQNGERIIRGGSVYLLAEVQAHVRKLSTSALNFATLTASDDLRDDLRWNLSDLCGFICALDPCFYRRSIWCLPAGGRGVPFPADVYIMGYNRIKKEQSYVQNPGNYLKFSFCIRKDTIEIFSIHTAEKNKSLRYASKK